ncbi:uncharacterized protein LOC131890223 isoform X2 [Tigriopus californicus]|uniref:uncharacterized protein LOC131890223 isoform X2 n=1 Tax=Tigriopus californicus TaxID=6832 RepID=UPI0027DA55D5|nr:uncharacterized protein LOC131890223 isoform X2 [Tigriopus californicus]
MNEWLSPMEARPLLFSNAPVIAFVFLVTFGLQPLECQSDDSPGEGIQPTTDSDLGLHIGDTCTASCSTVIKNSFCNTTTNTCQCLGSHPIVIEEVTCVAVKKLHQTCSYDQQCKVTNPSSYCFQFEQGDLRCWCQPGFHSELIQENPIKYGCLEDLGSHLSKHSVSALTALTIGLSILSCLLCLMFRIFTRSHWSTRSSRSQYSVPSPPNRETSQGGSGASRKSSKGSQGKRLSAGSNGSAAKRSCHEAPEIMLHGELVTEQHLDSLDIEKQLYRPAIYNSLKSPQVGTSPAIPRTTGSRNNSLTTSSGENSRRPSGQFCEEWPEGFTDADTEYEQHIAIVPNPRAKRRQSMADYAFPELHSRSKGKKEPENLLILTRTRVDKHGRRHSVAVPLVPPPDGEKFEGGYHMERNPITGGAKLVPPAINPKSVISNAGGNGRTPATSSSSSALLGPPTASTTTLGVGGGGGFSRFDRKSSRYRNRTISGLPTIGEANQPNRSRTRRSASDRGSARRGYGTGSQKVKAKVDVEAAAATNTTDTKAGRTRRMSLQIPQSNGGVNNLARDMERLKVGGAQGGAVGGGGSSSGAVSPRPLKRKTSRRSSRSSFLHFLDLAIAK